MAFVKSSHYVFAPWRTLTQKLACVSLHADLQQQYTTYKNNLQQLAEKIGNVEQETEEHKLVLETLTPLPKDRKCFRMINGVLVERTVEDVLPALQTNADGLKKLLDELVKQYKRQQEDMEKWKLRACEVESSNPLQACPIPALVHKAMRNHFAAVWRLLRSCMRPGRVGSSIIGRFFYVRTRQGTAQWSDMSGSVNVKYLGPEDIASTTLQGTVKSLSDLAILATEALSNTSAQDKSGDSIVQQLPPPIGAQLPLHHPTFPGLCSRDTRATAPIRLFLHSARVGELERPSHRSARVAEVAPVQALQHRPPFVLEPASVAGKEDLTCGSGGRTAGQAAIRHASSLPEASGTARPRSVLQRPPPSGPTVTWSAASVFEAGANEFPQHVPAAGIYIMSVSPPKEDVEHGGQSPENSEPMDRGDPEAQARDLAFEFEVKEQDRWLPIAN
ncbi:MAG: hypothetical protein LQ341_004576, partial [Variospora aurantia]